MTHDQAGSKATTYGDVCDALNRFRALGESWESDPEQFIKRGMEIIHGNVTTGTMSGVTEDLLDMSLDEGDEQKKQVGKRQCFWYDHYQLPCFQSVLLDIARIMGEAVVQNIDRNDHEFMQHEAMRQRALQGTTQDCEGDFG